MFNKLYEKIKSFILENYKFLVAIILLILLFKIDLPYVIYKPGGSINLNKRIEVENGYDADGTLEMAYVSLVKGNLPFLGLAFLLPNWDILPNSDIVGEEESVEEALERDKIYYQESIDNATIVAYKAANKKIDIEKTNNNVIYIAKEADTELKIYDQILKVENKEIASLDDLKKIVNIHEAGDTLNLQVLRKNKKLNVKAKVYDTNDGLKIGVSLVNTYEYNTDPKINIKTRKSESGPSGGLMLALSIYNKLTENDITKGKKIVGTGTISIDGKVGEIGGVKYKVMGAAKKNADVFLCPKENYQEALDAIKDNDYDIELVSVATFKDALNYLEGNIKNIS